MSEKMNFQLSFFNTVPIHKQMEQKGILIKDEKHKAEIRQYEDLMSSINFAYLMDVVEMAEREKILKRLEKRLIQITKEVDIIETTT